jgi:3-oxoacyl-[acyl-carrier protein] reductase
LPSLRRRCLARFYRDLMAGFEVTINGRFWVTAEVMEQQKSGNIVNISSQAGVFYSRGQGCHYAASKAAIIQLTRVLSFELGPLGIRINSIAPGSLSLEPTTERAIMPTPRPLENVPLGRLGSAEDVARAVLFFASDQSQFITGQTLLVNGGVIV